MDFKVYSMTGFSCLSTVLPNKNINITMTLRSLNSRHFEFNCKIPILFNSIETDIIKLVKNRLLRGNIFLSIFVESYNNLGIVIEPDLNILDQYINSIEKIKNKYNISGDLKINDVINLPNIFSSKDEILENNLIDFIINKINKLIDLIIETRYKEGHILAQDLFERFSLIKKYIESLEKKTDIVINNRKLLIDQNITNILKNLSINPEINLLLEKHSNFINELQALIYNQLDKIDIHEEITRFKLHIGTLINLLVDPKIEKGKKIDFILQELFREINTISCKCSDPEISNIAINIKVEIEKAREQAQNIV